MPFIHIVPCYLFSLPSASPLTSPPSVNPLGLFLGLGSPLEASGPLARSIKMPKRIHWWLMSPGEWEGDQGIISKHFLSKLKFTNKAPYVAP